MSMTTVARDSFEAYHSADYARCSKLLEQIGNFKNAFDVKVSHNTLLNEYFKSGCADPQQLLTQLSQAYDRARERDKKEKGRRKKDEDDEDTYREDDELYVLRYNQALLCVQLRQYAQARFILEELFDNIEPIDDFLAIKICFLLLELCLLQREPEHGVAVLNYLEKPNAFLTVLRRERPAAKAIEARPLEGDQEDGDEEKHRDGDETGDVAELLKTTDSKAVAEPAVVAANSDAPESAAGPLPSLAVGAFLTKHGRAPDTISRAEFRFFCLMYRARVSMALKNMKAAKKDSKSALEVLEQELQHAPLLVPHEFTTGKDASKGSEDTIKDMISCHERAMVNVVKAYLEYSKQNVRKSVKLLSLCRFNFAAAGRPVEAKAVGSRKNTDEDEEHIPTDFHPAQDDACASVFFNNMGCIHFMMHKPNLAAYYFQKALRAKGAPSLPPPSSQPTGDNRAANEISLSAKAGLTLPGVAVTRHWLDRRAETAYNAGLQMLMSNRPSAAYKCFEQCMPVFRSWPRLWVRLAECCIEMHRQSISATGAASDTRGPEGTSNGLANRARQLVTGSASGGGTVPAGSFCAAMGSSNVGSGVSRLTCGAQGSGHHRRWLLVTERNSLVGNLASGEDLDAKAGEQRTGPAGAPASSGPATQTAKAMANGVEAEQALAGDEALVRAAMCLRNVLVLTAPTLSERATPSAEAAADATAAAGTASAANGGAGLKASKGSPSAGSKPGSSSAGRNQARDLVESEASLLEDSALVKLAYVSLCQHDHAAALTYSRRLLEKNNLVPLAPADPAKDPSKPPTAAEEAEESKKNWTFQAFNLPHSKDPKAIQAKTPSSMGTVTTTVLYSTEALLLAGKLAEAKALLGTFVTGNCLSKGLQNQSSYFSEFERGSPSVLATAIVSHETDGEPRTDQAALDVPPSLCGGLSPSTSVGGITPPSYLVTSSGIATQTSKERDAKDADKEKSNSKDTGPASIITYEDSVFPHLGEMQCTLYTNMAALHTQDGNFEEAQRACEKALQIQPRALAPLRTLVFLLLKKGQATEALRRLKEGRATAT